MISCWKFVAFHVGTLFPEESKFSNISSSNPGDTEANLLKPTGTRFQLKSAASLNSILDNSILNGANTMTESNCVVRLKDPTSPGTSATTRKSNTLNDLSMSLKVLAASATSELYCTDKSSSNAVREMLPSSMPQKSSSPKPAKCLTRELEDLLHYGWYWGSLSKEEAEAKLKDQPDGAFVVRDSTSDHYLLSLSFNRFRQY